MPRRRRDNDGRLRLAVQLATDIASSEGRGGYGISIGWSEASGASAEIREPSRAAVRDLMTDLRKFDSPGEDVYLPDLVDAMRSRGIETSWDPGVTDALAHYESMQQPNEQIRIQDPDDPTHPDSEPRFMAARDAFELWAYGEHLHNDLSKIERLDRFDPISRALVRQLGHDYLSMLDHVALFLASVIVFGMETPLDPPIPPPSWLTQSSKADDPAAIAGSSEP